MHIHDAPGKEIEQRRPDDAGAEQYDDVRAPLPDPVYDLEPVHAASGRLQQRLHWKCRRLAE